MSVMGRLIRRPVSPRQMRWSMMLITGGLVVAGVIGATHKSACGCGPPKRYARIVVTRYAQEALQKWQLDAPGICPPDLQALDEYVNSTNAIDPWRRPYVLECRVENGRAVGYVASTGEDGQLGTSDDIAAPLPWPGR